MKRAFFVFFALVLINVRPVLAEGQTAITGRLTDKDSGAGIALATVVLYETDEMTESDEAGRFVLHPPAAGSYTIGAFAEGYEELETTIEIPLQGELVIALTKVTFTMDITVTGQREKTQKTESIGKDQIANTPTGGDPFEVIQGQSDVVKPEGGILDRDYGIARLMLASALGFQMFAFISPFSYRSLPDYSNAYFLQDYIPLPFVNYPSVSNAFSRSIFPETMVQSMDLYGGGIEPSLGPGAGLIVSANVTKQDADAFDWAWQVSLLGADVKVTVPVFGFSTLEASLRKSYYEYTWLPLLFLLDRQLGWGVFYDPFGDVLQTTVAPGDGDLFLHYTGKFNDINDFALDVVTCLSYVNFVMDRVYFYGEGADHQKAEMDSLYLLNAAGFGWTSKPAQGFENALEVFDSLYTSSDYSRFAYFSGEFTGSQTAYPFNIAGAKETASMSLFKGLDARFGAEFRNIYGSFLHTDDVSEYYFPGAYEPTPDYRGQDLLEYEAALYGSADWEVPPFRFKPSVRLDWFSKAMGPEPGVADIRPSPLLTSIWYPDDKSELELSIGQRTDRFDYMSWILFNAAQGEGFSTDWVSGSRSVIDEKYLMKAPARLSAAQGAYRLELPGFRLGLLGYGYYMDEMSGFNYQSFKVSEIGSMLTNAGSGEIPAAEGTGFRDADRMYSLGFTAKAAFTWKPVELSLNYTLGYSQFHLTETDSWVTPNSDITNYLKLLLHFPLFERWFWDIGMNVACGIPATPSKLVSYDPTVQVEYGFSQTQWMAVSDQYNQMRDWMPRITVNFQTYYKWDSGLTLFIDVANLISLVHYDGPDPNKVQVGGVETSWLDRKYKLFAATMDILLNLKVDFGLKYNYK